MAGKRDKTRRGQFTFADVLVFTALLGLVLPLFKDDELGGRWLAAVFVISLFTGAAAYAWTADRIWFILWCLIGFAGTLSVLAIPPLLRGALEQWLLPTPRPVGVHASPSGRWR